MYNIEFSEHDCKSKSIYGGAVTEVSCIATFKNDEGCNEKYSINFYRNPITGELQSVECEEREEETTTEHTLTTEAVCDYVRDELI